MTAKAVIIGILVGLAVFWLCRWLERRHAAPVSPSFTGEFLP